MNTNQTTFPFLAVLTLIFITLKLTGYLAWSWFWVLSPMILPITILILLAALATLSTKYYMKGN